MQRISIKSGVAIVLAAGTLVAHGAVPRPTPVQIRVSAANTIPKMRTIRFADRYELRNATLTDLILSAWGAGAADVIGGPEWLDTDRFDVLTRVAVDSNPEQLKTMLQGLLRDKFALRVHTRKQRMAAYTLTATNVSQLRRGSVSGASGCELKQNLSTAPGATRPPVTLTCTNTTMGALAQNLSDLREASGYLLGYPVLDRTGLAGIWTFSARWTPRNALHADPAAAPGDTIFEALENQLGLKLNLTAVPATFIVVDRVRRPKVAPSADSAPHFEAADIRPTDLHDSAQPCGHIDIQPGGQVHINMTLRSVILESQGDFNTHQIIDHSNSLDAPCWQIRATAPTRPDAPRGLSGPEWNGVDIGSLRMMLRSLLEQRFGLATHTERHPVSGYALVASHPKLKQSDGSNRPGCREGPWADETGPTWRDPRLTNPLASRLISCRNVTLVQFAAGMSRLKASLGGPIVDATQLPGRFDISINFSPGAWFEASGPRQLISVSEALRTQLGLDLRQHEVPSPVLVVDHIEKQPRSADLGL
jgi:uncharacterized protein (TIGR03435 family)